MRYKFLLPALLLPALLTGQITSPSANAVRYTYYKSMPSRRDPVFIFCNSTGNIKGALNAASPGGTGPFSFTWYQWSDATKSFSIPLLAQSGVFSSALNNLDEGGYLVNINDGAGYDRELVAWVSIDKPGVQASLQNRTCDYVALKGDTASDNFYYRNPDNGQPIKLPNKLKFQWSSDPASSIPYPDFEINPQTFDPPLVDVTYKLTVTDSLTCSAESSFLYQSIHVKADFKANPETGDAPLNVGFGDNSVRGYQYKWEFGDDSVRTYIKHELTDSVRHTYYKPGEYSVKLTIESELHCIDSLRFNYISVDPSDVQIPNVFTPDGDGYNDNFFIYFKSLRFLSVEIFSQSGLKVYGFTGDGELLKSWTGWDGNINNSSVRARPGVYYYIVRALGWDDKKYDSKEYRGFVYLYR